MTITGKAPMKLAIEAQTDYWGYVLDSYIMQRPLNMMMPPPWALCVIYRGPNVAEADKCKKCPIRLSCDEMFAIPLSVIPMMLAALMFMHSIEPETLSEKSPI